MCAYICGSLAQCILQYQLLATQAISHANGQTLALHMYNSSNLQNTTYNNRYNMTSFAAIWLKLFSGQSYLLKMGKRANGELSSAQKTKFMGAVGNLTVERGLSRVRELLLLRPQRIDKVITSIDEGHMGTDLQVEETEEGEATFSKSRSNYAGLPDYWYLEFLPSLAPQVLSPVMMQNRTTPNEWPQMGGCFVHMKTHVCPWVPCKARQNMPIPTVHQPYSCTICTLSIDHHHTHQARGISLAKRQAHHFTTSVMAGQDHIVQVRPLTKL